MPFEALCLPEFKPLHFGARLAEELHLHLLELPHTEDELPGNHLVTESFADLGDTEGDFHAAGFLHIYIVHENALCGFGAQINSVRSFARAAELSAEHQIELPYIRPVFRAGNRVYNIAIENYLLILGKIACSFSGFIALAHLIIFCLFAEDIGVSLAELGLIKSFSEALAPLLHLFFYLLLYLGKIILNQIIGAIAFFTVFIID